jgi:thymidylate synthase
MHHTTLSATAGMVWLRLMQEVLEKGHVCAPRGKRIRELLAAQSCVDMSWPVTNVIERRLGKRFMCAEAAWILSGDNRVETIRNYSPTISNFSDDARYFKGAYGPKIVDQLTYIVDAITQDVDTRQAVLNIWRENPRVTKDVPCTINVQWLVRDGMLHCVDTMRSSDLWLGWPYDIFNFSMLSGFILLMIRERRERSLVPSSFPDLTLGRLHLNAGSQHIYEEQWRACDRLTSEVLPQTWSYTHFDPYEFLSPTHLVEHLWRLANKDQSLRDSCTSWLAQELIGPWNGPARQLHELAGAGADRTLERSGNSDGAAEGRLNIT